MTVAMPAPPNKTMHSLLCQQQRRLSSRSLHNSGSQRSKVCMCLLVQSAEPVPVESSIVRQHAGCTVRLPPPLHQITQQLGALAAQSSMSFEDQRSHGRTIASFFSASPATAATFGFDALSLQRSVRGHRTVTSIQSCCKTPGNQETTSKTAHRITGAASSLSLTHS